MKIIDLTWRLPGPFATSLLAKQGMEVIKYEDRNYRDPFLLWEWDPSFAEIYHAFQEPKELRLCDFSDQGDVSAIQKEIESADGVVMSLPPRVEAKLGLREEEVAGRYEGYGISFLRLGFRPDDNRSAHDLNTLAQSELLRMHVLDRTDEIIPPPFLPVTGLFFSHHIAISLLVQILRTRGGDCPTQEWCWLQDAVDRVRDGYYPASIQDRAPETFLHNGRFPCYNIYRTKDGGHVAMACVEPKFWSRFRELTGLGDQLGDGDGLIDGQRGEEVKGMILSRIREKSAAEWDALFSAEDVCVDVLMPQL